MKASGHFLAFARAGQKVFAPPSLGPLRSRLPNLQPDLAHAQVVRGLQGAFQVAAVFAAIDTGGMFSRDVGSAAANGQRLPPSLQSVRDSFHVRIVHTRPPRQYAGAVSSGSVSALTSIRSVRSASPSCLRRRRALATSPPHQCTAICCKLNSRVLIESVTRNSSSRLVRMSVTPATPRSEKPACQHRWERTLCRRRPKRLPALPEPKRCCSASARPRMRCVDSPSISTANEFVAVAPSASAGDRAAKCRKVLACGSASAAEEAFGPFANGRYRNIVQFVSVKAAGQLLQPPLLFGDLSNVQRFEGGSQHVTANCQAAFGHSIK